METRCCWPFALAQLPKDLCHSSLLILELRFMMAFSACLALGQLCPFFLPLVCLCSCRACGPLESRRKMVFQKSPNGGWGWVIVLSSFFTQFLCYGSPLAVGVLYVEWLDLFGEGKGKTAWVGSLASGVGLLASKSSLQKKTRNI